MPSTTSEHYFAVLCIFIDVLNLGEQLGIYFAQKAIKLDEIKEREFFFILFGIGAANLFKPIFHNERIKTAISLLIDIGELFCYLFVLERTTGVMAIALTFFGLQMCFHVINIYLAETKGKTPMVGDKIKEFFYRLLIYISINIGPLLTLFLDSESRFHQALYEISFIISIFLHNVLIDIVMELHSVLEEWLNKTKVQIAEADETSFTRPDFKKFLKNKTKIQRIWIYGNYLIATVFNLLFLAILTSILVSLELKTGDQLPSYDRGLYIYLLVGTSMIFFMSPCLFGCLGYFFYMIFF